MSRDQARHELLQLYQKFNPAKVNDIPQLLEKYNNQLVELVTKVKEKYIFSPRKTPNPRDGGGAVSTPRAVSTLAFSQHIPTPRLAPAPIPPSSSVLAAQLQVPHVSSTPHVPKPVLKTESPALVSPRKRGSASAKSVRTPRSTPSKVNSKSASLFFFDSSDQQQERLLDFTGVASWENLKTRIETLSGVQPGKYNLAGAAFSCCLFLVHFHYFS
jgi:hypothetical protein